MTSEPVGAFVCPLCNARNRNDSTSWDQIGYIPIICVSCSELFWVKIKNDKSQEIIIVNHPPVFKTQIPELQEGTWVFILNKEHERHLEPAKITKRDHKHYRVEFNDGMQLWVPQHWVEVIPKEMLE